MTAVCLQAGLSGAIAIHAIYSTDETVLFFERPHVNPANPEVVPNPYLTVSTRRLFRVCSFHLCSPMKRLFLSLFCLSVFYLAVFLLCECCLWGVHVGEFMLVACVL